MKRLLQKSIFTLVAFFFIPNLLSPIFISAQEPTNTPSPKVEATPSAFIKYDLAYPGILPDHPLYKLKVLRDKISAGLIGNPQKKIEYYLLQTDKGILATAILVDKNKIELAKQTLLKAENNYTLLTYELWGLPIKVRNDASFFNKLKKASLKHQEVIISLMARIPQKDHGVFKNVLYFSKRNWQTVEDYLKNTSFR